MSRRQSWAEMPNCVYTPAVGCQWGDRPPGRRERCEKCGWNPKVSRRRAEKVREKMSWFQVEEV